MFFPPKRPPAPSKPPPPRPPPPPTPLFDDEPSESLTGQTGIAMGEWRQLGQVFYELEIEGKGALLQVAYALLCAQEARAVRMH